MVVTVVVGGVEEARGVVAMGEPVAVEVAVVEVVLLVGQQVPAVVQRVEVVELAAAV